MDCLSVCMYVCTYVYCFDLYMHCYLLTTVCEVDFPLKVNHFEYSNKHASNSARFCDEWLELDLLIGFYISLCSVVMVIDD